MSQILKTRKKKDIAAMPPNTQTTQEITVYSQQQRELSSDVTSKFPSLLTKTLGSAPSLLPVESNSHLPDRKLSSGDSNDSSKARVVSTRILGKRDKPTAFNLQISPLPITQITKNSQAQPELTSVSEKHQQNNLSSAFIDKKSPTETFIGSIVLDDGARKINQVQTIELRRESKRNLKKQSNEQSS